MPPNIFTIIAFLLAMSLVVSRKFKFAIPCVIISFILVYLFCRMYYTTTEGFFAISISMGLLAAHLFFPLENVDAPRDEPVWIRPSLSALAFLGVLVLMFKYTVGFSTFCIRDGFLQCQSNCKNIGTALEMYATDNDGKYPDSMDMVVPTYLNELPVCMAQGMSPEVRAHYRKQYGLTLWDYAYKVSDNHDSYTFYCSGNNHQAFGVGPNYPQYDCNTGLTAR